MEIIKLQVMKQTLIKLSNFHYIVVDDSEIKKGDWIFKMNEPLKNTISISNGGESDDWKKISRSYGAAMPTKLEKFPLSEVEEAIYGYSWEIEFDKQGKMKLIIK